MDIKTKLKDQLDYVLEKSPFYKAKFNNIKSSKAVEIFDKLPLTTKSEILEDQRLFPPYGSNICVDIKDISRVHKTSGTTHSPVIVALTRSDISHVTEVGCECFKESGLNETDIVIHCLNFNMWAEGLTDDLNLEATGATVVPFGVGNTTGLINMIKLLKATAIHCTPSYLSKIEQVLRDEFNMRPDQLGLRLGLFGAESGLQNPQFRKGIEEKWGIIAMNANYGMSEVLSIIASECRFRNGLHFRAGDKLYVELLDTESGKTIPIEKEASGELVFTNLLKQAQPLVRYRTGDVVKIIDLECECGNNGFIFEVIGRSDDLLVIKGLNVFVSAIETVISRQVENFNGIYEVLVSRQDPIEDIVF